MMDTASPPFATLAELVAWCRRAPAGTSVDARTLAGILAEVGTEAPTPSPEPAPAVEAETWRTRIWTVPSETRLGVAEAAEALGRPRSFIYARTGPKAEDRIPHRKLDGTILFAAGELRAWLHDHEDVVASGPMDPPSRPLRSVRGVA
jgi:hypothetical protein